MHARLMTEMVGERADCRLLFGAESGPLAMA